MKLNLDDLSLNDLQDFIEMQSKHREKFVKWCAENPYAGADDELDNDLEFLEKAFLFFDKRGYII
jgi:hypothetical protein